MVIDDSIKVISIDLDDTLWDNIPVLETAEARLYAWLKDNVPALTDEYSPQELKKHRQKLVKRHPELRHNLTRQRFISLAELLQTVGMNKGYAEKAMEVFLDARSNVKLYDDVIPMLKKLSTQYILISLTNGNANIAQIGLDKYFYHAFYAADIGAAKPDPLVFDYVVKKLKLSPVNIVHVGDDPDADIIGAKEAGIKNIWINRKDKEWPENLPKPDAEIVNLYELPDV